LSRDAKENRKRIADEEELPHANDEEIDRLQSMTDHATGPHSSWRMELDRLRRERTEDLDND
jgi:hypothetical protein